MFFGYCLHLLFVNMWAHLQLEIKEERSKLEELEKEYTQQIEENESISKEIEQGISDEEMEKIAREEEGYVMPGEHVYADASLGK